MSDTVTVTPPSHMVHITRPGGKQGLDSKGNPKESSADTLLSLAKEYGVRWQDIAQATFDTTDSNKIEVMLRDEGYGVAINNHWYMVPGLQVKIPVGADGKPVSPSNPPVAKIPAWAKWLGLAAAGAAGLWALDHFTGDEPKGRGGRRLAGARDDEDDEPDDDEPDDD